MVILIILALAALAIGYYLIRPGTSEKDLLSRYGLTGLTPEQMVERLDQITNESDQFKSSVYGDRLTISEGKTKLEYPIREDKFYLSLAPYINTTHECSIHSLKGCRGELKNETFHITVTDSEGNTVLSEERTSMDNGFIGFWLKRGTEGTITVRYQDMEATADYSAVSTGYTCLTTPLQLKK